MGDGHMNQTARLVAFLRTHPNATSLEITLAINCVNVTGRVSDARAQGYVIECERRFDGRQSYRLIDEPVQQVMFG